MKPESLKTQADKFFEIVRQRQRFLVTTHVSPDGDAIASLLAAARLIHLMGSHATCCLDGEIPSYLAFLPGSADILTPQSCTKTDFDAVLAVDAATFERLGETAKLFRPGEVTANIDHHRDNTEFAQLNLLFPEAASTTEILFHLATTLNLTIDNNLATLLYTGLATDTGGFRFSNTSASALQMAGYLATEGANPNLIAEAVFSSNTESSMRLLANALSNLVFSCNGRVASMTVDAVDDWEEPEDLAEYPLRVRGVMASGLFRRKDGKTRVSLRSRGSVSVSEVAHKFGGGGHPNAAGFRTEEEMDPVRLKVIDALIKEVEKSSS